MPIARGPDSTSRTRSRPLRASPPPGRQAVILAWDAAQEEVVLIAQVGERPVALDDQGAMALLSDAYLGQNLAAPPPASIRTAAPGAGAGCRPGLTADTLETAIQRTLSAARACLLA